VLEQIARRSLHPDEAKTEVRRLGGDELRRARPLHAPEVGVDHNTALEQASLAEQPGHVRGHREGVLPARRADLDHVVAGEVRDRIVRQRQVRRGRARPAVAARLDLAQGAHDGPQFSP
jgi:hypothetical protein